LGLLSRQLLIWWRGTRFRERPASEIPAKQLEQLDVCWSAGMVLTLVDTIRGLMFRAQHYLLALRAGEPYRVALALLAQARHVAAAGVKAQARAEALLRTAEELVQRIDQPYARAMLASMGGAVAVLTWQWKKACTLTEQAESIFRKECTGVAWELGATYHFRFIALHWSGRWKQCAAEIPPLLREARERGDLFTETLLLIHSALPHLAADEPDRAAGALAEAARQWPDQGFYLQHYHLLFAEAETALYRGNGVQAWELVRRRWAALEQSQLLRIEAIRAGMIHLRARCALAAAAVASGAPAQQLVRSAERDARVTERAGMPAADGIALLTRAAVAVLRNRLAQAVDLLLAAEACFAAVDMVPHAVAARRRRGQLLGGHAGQELVLTADAVLAAQGVRNPARITAMLVPGFPAGE
jgi:hypothetical protein